MADILRFCPYEVTNLIDVGANIGQTCREFRRYFPHANIHAFEPVSATFNRLNENTRDLQNVTTHQLAIGDHEGTATLWLQANNQVNSLNPNLNIKTNTSETVSVTTLDSFASQNDIQRIDVLKSDTENFDLEVINGSSNLLAEGRISFVLSEVGLTRNDTAHTNLSALSEHLAKHNYLLMSIYDRLYHYKAPRVRGWCNALFIRDDLLKQSSES